MPTQQHSATFFKLRHPEVSLEGQQRPLTVGELQKLLDQVPPNALVYDDAGNAVSIVESDGQDVVFTR